MLFLDKTRALDLIIANSEQISVPEPYRLAASDAIFATAPADGAAACLIAQPWAWAEAIVANIGPPAPREVSSAASSAASPGSGDVHRVVNGGRRVG